VHRGGDQGKAGDTESRGLYFDERDQESQAVPAALAELLRAHGREVGGGDGGLQDLRVPGGDTGGHQRGRHDGGLGAAAV